MQVSAVKVSSVFAPYFGEEEVSPIFISPCSGPGTLRAQPLPRTLSTRQTHRGRRSIEDQRVALAGFAAGAARGSTETVLRTPVRRNAD